MAGAGIHRQAARNGDILTGLDVFVADTFRPLLTKRIGLITNHTGIDREGKRNIDRMREAGVHIAAVFSPEHGFLGVEDRPGLSDTVDPATGLKVYSLYGKSLRPTPQMLTGIDALVFDIQDIGVRFYTYVSTMGYAMEAAAKARIPIYVLDRPNPITGTQVEGPILDRDKLSFVGYFPLPLRHGMTIGELANMFNQENRIAATLTVVRMKGWQRGDWFDSTNLPWINPSPNIRSLNAALLYPGLAMLEYAKNYSVGRGTDAPFEQIGSEFIRGTELASYLNRRYIPGVRVYPTRFRPESSNLAGKTIEGVRFIITQRQAFNSSRLGLEVASALLALYAGQMDLGASEKLLGSAETIRALQAGEDPRMIHQKLEDALGGFLQVRNKYLLYR
jgi:uncharacterized protein YbbC (DUF1343 family)